MLVWQVDIEFTNSIYYTWKGEAVTNRTILQKAINSAGIDKGLLGGVKNHRIKLLTKRVEK